MSHATDGLVHYTDSPETVGSILRHGFLLVPNKRYLINALLGENLFTDREPQEFGMVSFTQRPPDGAIAHRERFGSFGIVVSWEWAQAHDAQRVIYVDQGGPVAATFAWLFRLGRQELERSIGQAPSPMTLENKAMAFTKGSTLYARLLTLYEYMEPERNSAQVEWRIVNKVPQYHDLGRPRGELVKELLSIAKTWKSFGAVQIAANDIKAFLSPRDARTALIDQLPAEYREVPILTYRRRERVTRLQTARDRALFAHRGRERTIEVEKPLPKDRIWLTRNSNGNFHLPEAERVSGALLYLDELASGVRVNIQYQSTTGNVCELVVPIRDALYLLNILKAIQHDNGLDFLNPSNDAGR